MAESWTPRELATLAALAESFVRGEAARRARQTTEALDKAADPTQIRQLRLVLRLMESRLVNLLFARRPRPFTSMSPAAKERYLLAWANSRIGLRRSAFSSLRKLLTFFAYADPGADVSGNPRHPVIGYEPEWPPITAERTSIQPHQLPFDVGGPHEPMTLEADVVIVGSGAGGGVVAAAAAEAGRSVIVLEMGPFVDEASMPHNELDAYDRLYLNHGLVTTWDGAITMLAGSGVGGGTLVNWMTAIEAPPRVRAMWSRIHGIDELGDGEAWSDDIATLERASCRSRRSSICRRRTWRSCAARSGSAGKRPRSGATLSPVTIAAVVRSAAAVARSSPGFASIWRAPRRLVRGSCPASA